MPWALCSTGLGGSKVLVDPVTAPVWAGKRLEAAGATVVYKPDPCQLPKARKNTVELNGTRNAHRRDGAALVRFLAWLAKEAPTGHVTELDAVEQLYRCRREDPLFRTNSFDTISGAGPNGAIVHYRVTPQTSRRLEPGMLYLVDSGGQYLDGTTDVTRTVAIGTPSDEQRDRFTRVLKGHIALATAVSPKGPAADSLTCWRANICGRWGWIMTTAPATALAAIWGCTRGRSGSAAWAQATWRWSRA